MLDGGQVDALEFLLANDTSRLESAAERAGQDYAATVGIARKLIGEQGSTSGLSAAQAHVYQRAIRPLLVDVPCEGPLGYVAGEQNQSTCAAGGTIDSESLRTAYEMNDFVCQTCRFDRDKMDLS
jgi:hypothetical protein